MIIRPVTTLILGGCRSGKSRLALDRAAALSKAAKGFIATCVPRDAEMHDRVTRHQQERGADWRTLEVPLDLAHGIQELAATVDVLVVDCLTLWISNLLLDDQRAPLLDRDITALLDVLRQPPCSIILVSNEVGMGVVPDNAMGRRFRDTAGRLNQQVAEVVDQVIWSMAGIPVPIKPVRA